MLLCQMLLLCACNGQLQPMASASQPTPTQSPASVASPAVSPTFATVSNPTNIPSEPQPLSQTPTPGAPFQRTELVEALRGGGYVIYIHNGGNDPSQGNIEEDLKNCPQLSNASDQGQTDARAIGASFLALSIPVGQVLHSGSCSSRAMAILIPGQAENWLDLIGSATPLRGERIAALRQVLSTRPQPGTNNVFVGQGLDITDVTGLAFTEGETAIYKPLGEIGYSFVTRLFPETWDELVRNTSDRVQLEAYDLDSIPLESVEPTLEPDSSSPSAGVQSQLIPPDQSLTPERDFLLPDLVTLPPTDLNIRVNPADQHKLLRFTNSIMNLGPGGMELWGAPNPGGGKMTVTQQVFDSEGVTEAKVVGEFFFHPEHDHWHLGDFARYEIWSVGADGELVSVVAVSNKVSYCLRDDSRSDLPEATSRQTYTSCDQKRQGISVGWVDIYRFHLPGQSIDINFLPDGVYALRSTVDPENNLLDKNPENNTAILYISIEGNRVSIVESIGN